MSSQDVKGTENLLSIRSPKPHFLFFMGQSSLGTNMQEFLEMRTG